MQATSPPEMPPESPRFVVGGAVFVATTVIAFPALIFAMVVPAEPTCIRLCNATGRDLSSIELDSQSYGNLVDGGNSEYKHVLRSFGSSSVSAIAGSLGKASGPANFCPVGAEPLPPGRYTLVVQLIPSEGGGYSLHAQRESGESACPNHSIEGTNNGGPALGFQSELVPPSFSPHVKR